MATFLRTRASLQIVGQSTPSLITHYWDSTGAAIGLLATEAVARVRAHFAALNTSIAAGAIYTPNLVVDEIDENTGALANQISASAPAAVSFTGANDPLPFFTQALERYATNLYVNGRRVQGRSYVPGITELFSTGNPPVPTSTVLASLVTAMSALGTTIVTPMSQRVWHRPGPSGPGLSTPVISRSAAPYWAVLKSRRS